MSAPETPDATAAGGEEGLAAARRAKAEAVRARKENPFANDVDASDRVTLRDLRTRFASAVVPGGEGRYDPAVVDASASGEAGQVHVFGRIVAHRGFGKASFWRLRDATGEI